jgi:CHAD domain-containing protein
LNFVLMSSDSLPIPEIDIAVTSGEAVCQILAGLLDDLATNAPGALIAADIEYLHKYRVAIRRMRALVGQFKDIMPAQDAEYLSGELRWLGQLTSPLRDADTFLAVFDSYRGWLPEEMQHSLHPLHEYLRKNQKVEQEKFIRALMDNRYTLFIANARAFVAKGYVDWNNKAWSIYIDLAGAKIWRLYRKMLRRGRKIGPDSLAAALHEIRKDGKKLRYLTGFFEKISPAHISPGLSKQMRRFQAILGDHQDFEVRAETLMQFYRELMLGETAPHHTCLATGILIGRLNAHQAGARTKFEASYNEFSRKRSRSEFRALYKKAEFEQTAII